MLVSVLSAFQYEVGVSNCVWVSISLIWHHSYILVCITFVYVPNHSVSGAKGGVHVCGWSWPPELSPVEGPPRQFCYHTSIVLKAWILSLHAMTHSFSTCLVFSSPSTHYSLDTLTNHSVCIYDQNRRDPVWPWERGDASRPVCSTLNLISLNYT